MCHISAILEVYNNKKRLLNDGDAMRSAGFEWMQNSIHTIHRANDYNMLIEMYRICRSPTMRTNTLGSIHTHTTGALAHTNTLAVTLHKHLYKCTSTCPTRTWWCRRMVYRTPFAAPEVAHQSSQLAHPWVHTV